jgi:hypothetical protein
MTFAESGLEGVECLTRRSEALNRGDLATISLYREEKAGSHRLAIEQHGAGAAHSVLASYVGSRETQLVSNEIA